MSKFTVEAARTLARNAFTLRSGSKPRKEAVQPNAPLVGREDKLLEALRAGEARYREWEAGIRALKAFRKSDSSLQRVSETLSQHLSDALRCVSSMDEIEREEFEMMAGARDWSIEEIEGALTQIIRVAEDCKIEEGPAKKRRGRKLGIGKIDLSIVPLEEFAKVIRSFWIQATELKFGFNGATERGIRVPASAAARLLYDSAKILDDRFAVSHVEYVMKAVNARPQFRTELFGDAKIDASCRV
jgi:hypothetical protein